MKPKFKEPFNNCGKCCRLALCRASELFVGNRPPCQFLTADNLCGLVVAEQRAGSVSNLPLFLGIGCGCSMPDADTTDDEIYEFDAYCMAIAKNNILPAK